MSKLDELRRRLAESDAKVQPLKVRQAKLVKATAAELIAACEANPDHPVAAIYCKATYRMPPAKQIMVEAVDLEALLDNAEVVTEEVIEGDARVVRKRLVRQTRPLPAPVPAAAKPKE